MSRVIERMPDGIKVMMLVTNSGFCNGLINILKHLSSTIYILRIDDSNGVNQRIVAHIGYNSDTKIKELAFSCKNYSCIYHLDNFIKVLRPDFIIFPRITSKAGKIILLKIRFRHSLKFILYNSPSTLFIVKVPYLVMYSKGIREKIKYVIKGFASLLATVLFVLIFDALIVHDPISYKILSVLKRGKVLFIPPIWFPYMNINNSTQNLENIGIQRFHNNSSSLVMVSTVGYLYRRTYSEFYLLRLILTIAKKLSSIKFIITGVSLNDLTKVSTTKQDIPNNVNFLGYITGLDRTCLMVKSDIVFSPVAVPGASNRVMEALYYEKPIITNNLGVKYHIGLIPGYNCLQIDDPKNLTFIINLKSNKHILTLLEARIKLLKKIYIKYASEVIKHLLIDALASSRG
jgi:hypothetical protein